jgi:hypothetical protein
MIPSSWACCVTLTMKTVGRCLMDARDIQLGKGRETWVHVVIKHEGYRAGQVMLFSQH